MNKLVLANEGVFPITRDRHGNLLDTLPATDLPLSGTIQGEGKLAGTPSLFVRLAGCNLRCMWSMPDGEISPCDTPYASFNAEQDKQIGHDEVFDLIRHNLGNLKHVVITGGEPLLQKKPLLPLLKKLREELGVHITIETNGTTFPEELSRYIDLFSISPKLSNSNPSTQKLNKYGLKESGPFIYHAEKRLNIEVLQKFIDLCNRTEKELQLKFVVGHKDDYREIKEAFLSNLKSWNAYDILLMPLGATPGELKSTSHMTLEMALKNGWRFAPRLHIELFGSKAGV
jgi:7-carboxy-7-deazaguanine synthase